MPGHTSCRRILAALGKTAHEAPAFGSAVPAREPGLKARGAARWDLAAP
jgi:hypothetical protein